MEALQRDLLPQLHHALHAAQNGSVEFLDACVGFFHAVRWTEPFLLCLLAFHATCFVLVIGTRGHGVAHALLFLTFLSLVRAAEWLNTLASQHWPTFCSQNYFDSPGLFTSVVFSAPLLFNAVFILMYSLFQSALLLIKMKRAQLQLRRRKTAESREEESKKAR